MLKLYLQT